MPSRTQPEGYLMIDRRARGAGLFEATVVTCSHCSGQVMLNPDRKRDRGYCRKCDAYICDLCAASGECRPIVKHRDQVMTALANGRPIPLGEIRG